jgi:exopolysaccharide production protein ExoQ
MWQQINTWLLFWPLLTLIARQTVYFSGPARTAEAFQNGAAMGESQGPHFLLYVTLLFLFGFVATAYHDVWATLKNNLFIPAMLALAVVSAGWSPSPQVTVQMSIEVGLCTLFACYLSARYSIDGIMRLLIFMGCCASLLSIFFVVALPSYGIFAGYAGRAWQGICDHKNTLGLSMAFLLTPVFFTSSYSRGRKIAYGAMLLLLIWRSQSRGAWLDTAGTLLFVVWLHLIRRLKVREVAPIVLITSIVTTLAAALGTYYWSLLAVSMGKDPGMTGRSDIYVEVWRSILKHPLLGYGFGAFWYAGNPEFHRIALALRWPNIGYSENGILELLLQLGFIGTALVLLMIARALLQGARLLRSPHYSPRVGWFLTVLFLALLTNIDAGWFMTLNTLDWVLILIACIGMNREIANIPAPPPKGGQG